MALQLKVTEAPSMMVLSLGADIMVGGTGTNRFIRKNDRGQHSRFLVCLDIKRSFNIGEIQRIIFSLTPFEVKIDVICLTYIEMTKNFDFASISYFFSGLVYFTTCTRSSSS